MSAVPGLDLLFGPETEADSIRRTLAAMAAGYDRIGPQKASAAGMAAAEVTRRIVHETGGSRDAHQLAGEAWYMACTCEELGEFREAEARARHVISHGLLAGDQTLVAEGWVYVAIAARGTGSPLTAVQASERAMEYAGDSPARVMALLQLARSHASIRAASPARADLVADLVAQAEAAHAELDETRWGHVGYARGTYHPANLNAFAGDAMIRVERYGEAAPRLADAAAILDGTDGLELAYVWLLHARAALAGGQVGVAEEFAAAAVERARPRPAAWVPRIVGELDRDSGGAFAELAEQTAGWGFPAGA